MPRKRSTAKPATQPDAGRCRRCGKPKKFPPTRYIDQAHYVTDPYCSRRCLEKDLGLGDGDGARRKKDA